MCLTYQPHQETDSSDYSPPDYSSSSEETQNRPLQLSYILQFSGATSGNGFSNLSGASTASGNGFSALSGASTSRANGFHEPTGASTSSTGHGFSVLSSVSTASRNGLFHGPTGASTSNGNGIDGPTGALTSNGNGFYGRAGAAAMVLVKDVDDRDEHAVVLHRFRLGLGNQTIGVAEYRGLILGLTEALRKRYTEIAVQGNSELVVNQFLGNWEIHDQELRRLCDEALELRNSFASFSINHIDENLSRAVNDEAVRAISLAEGQVEEEPQQPPI